MTGRREPGAVAEGLGLTLLATLIWSIVPICVKVALRALDPFSIAFVRFVLAAAVLWLVLQRSASRKLKAGDWFWILAGGAGMMGNYTLYNIGLQHTTASAANLMVQIEVVGLVFLSRLFLKERLAAAKILGVTMTVAGIMIVFSGRGSLGDLAQSEYTLGNAIMILAGLSWSLYGLSQKALVNRGAPIAQGLVGIFTTAAVLSVFPTAVLHQSRGVVTGLVLLCLMVIGVFSTGIAYLLLGRAFRLLDASTVGATTSMLPVFTIVNARIFLHETLTWSLALGAALVVTGILTMAREDTGRARPA